MQIFQQPSEDGPSEVGSKLFQNCLKIGSLFLRTTTGTIWGVKDILHSYWLVLKEKVKSELPKSSRLTFSAKISTNNFTLLDEKRRPQDHEWLMNNRSRGIRSIEVQQIYLCWEHYLKFVKSCKNQVSERKWYFWLYEHNQVSRIQEPFCYNY